MPFVAFHTESKSNADIAKEFMPLIARINGPLTMEGPFLHYKLCITCKKGPFGVIRNTVPGPNSGTQIVE